MHLLLFPNTPLLIELVDIHRVFFSRVAITARTFNFWIAGPEHTYLHANQQRGAHSTQAYLKDKRIKFKSEQVPDADDGDEDESMRSIDSDEEVSRKASGIKDDDDDSGSEGNLIRLQEQSVF
ncbi:hypothetical protein EV421DRAFT_1899925 [Armillaria borealis]|uniref:Histone chaperone RTT106/FACT complex subunit SPT16-like middle domain-containing protein n=1 Tax=Armillaria borealis TaxID=47425 RepID=A0AA39JVB8_9AGAR|nr:hypothetical protein EV421DRAFT_1899925 [Armillaria borealis]